jgi:hypothetical protein
MITITQALEDKALFKPWFDGDSWNTWKAVLKGAHGLKLTKAERKLFEAVAERDPPTKPVREFWCVCGRRAGKDSVASAIAAYQAAFFDKQHKLRPGERALVVLLALDKDQAKIALNMIRAFFSEIPMLKSMVIRETREGLELSNGVDIQVYTNDFRSVRGRTILCAILDECAFWRDEESATPDSETYAALKPGLMTLKGTLIGISSPYRRSGLLYEKWKKAYGQNVSDTLVIRAPSIVMNPTLDPQEIEAAIAEDPAKNSAEYSAEWRSDIEGVFTQEALDAAIIPGRHELQPRNDVNYVGFVDPSGGASDSMTLGIAHREGEVAVLDLVRERKPPFAPSEVVAEFAETLKRYGISVVRGDRYAGEWTAEQFRAQGIAYGHSEKNKSDIYGELIPLINSGNTELLDNQRLLVQLGNLERRTARGGRSSIDHPPGGHDDLANAAAGALVQVAARSAPEFVFTGVPTNRPDFSVVAPQPYQPQGVVNPHGVADEYTLYMRQRRGYW